MAKESSGKITIDPAYDAPRSSRRARRGATLELIPAFHSPPPSYGGGGLQGRKGESPGRGVCRFQI
jgi:hypothetical protein